MGRIANYALYATTKDTYHQSYICKEAGKFRLDLCKSRKKTIQSNGGVAFVVYCSKNNAMAFYLCNT